MNKIAIALAVSAALGTATPALAGGQPSFVAQLAAVEEAPAQPAGDDNRLLIAGLGAIGGVVALNLMLGGTAALPFLYEAGAAAGGGTGSGAVAASRVLAVTSGVAGALAADYLYRRNAVNEPRAISRSLSQKVAPR